MKVDQTFIDFALGRAAAGGGIMEAAAYTVRFIPCAALADVPCSGVESGLLPAFAGVDGCR